MNFKIFKELSFKKKLQWLVQYYGVVALVSIIAIGIIFTLVKSILVPEPIADVCIMILSDDIYTEEAIEMQYELSKTLDSPVEIYAYMISDPYGMQYFATKVMTDQLDIIVAPKKETEELLGNSYISDFEALSDSDLCISVPNKARINLKQEQAMEYIHKYFEK